MTTPPAPVDAPTVVQALLGAASEPPWSTRRHDVVEIGWGDARKHRQLLRTASGRELALQLPRGSFLTDGAVLADDGATAVVVRRPAEPAIVVDFPDAAGAADVRAALLLGYLLGNQHAPLEVGATQLRAPLMTGTETALRMLADLGLTTADVREVPLAAHGWTMTSADHREGHRHE